MILVIGLTVIVTLSMVVVVMMVQTMRLLREAKQLKKSLGFKRGERLLDVQKRHYEKQKEAYQEQIRLRDEIIAELEDYQKRGWSKQAKSYLIENLSLNRQTTKG